MSTYGVEAAEAKVTAEDLRVRYGQDVMILAIKDQNYPGKICLSGGNPEQNLIDAITSLFKQEMSGEVVLESDKYDVMWDHTWRNTAITSGHSTFSLAKSYFPKGKIFVKLLDTITSFGWGLYAAPSFGGLEDDDSGNSVHWPVFVFYREAESKFTGQHLFFAVKDANIPGKLCAAGPIGELEADMMEVLKVFKDDVKSERDEYDADFDVVWRNTSITSGKSMMSLAKSYFPKGKTNIALLSCAYKHGWRAVAAPNFGGQGNTWPSLIFRKLKEPEAVPELLFGSIKDCNVPGKLCLAGPEADQMCDAVCGSLTKIEGNADAKSETDDYDADFDAVCRNVKITTGVAMFSLKLPYFPRCDSVVSVLNALAEERYQVVACPSFGTQGSWPTFVWEKKRDDVPDQIFMAIKDDNIPGKVCIGGGGVASDPTLAGELLEVLRALCGEKVEQVQDDYDRSFDICFKNTKVTSGHAALTMAKPFWPRGHVVELLLQVLFKHGWVCQGGPNFGENGNQWPSFVLSRGAAGVAAAAGRV